VSDAILRQWAMLRALLLAVGPFYQVIATRRRP